MRRLALLALPVALFGCAEVQHQSQLVQPIGKVQTATVGAPIATLRKQKDLPNIYGKSDIFGRKVDAGFTKLVFKGRTEKGEALIERIDVDVHSTASTMSRTPGTYFAQSTGSINGNKNGLYGSSQYTAQGTAPIAESTTVLPPQTVSFSVPAGKTLSIAPGRVVKFISVEPHQVTYSIEDAGSA